MRLNTIASQLHSAGYDDYIKHCWPNKSEKVPSSTWWIIYLKRLCYQIIKCIIDTVNKCNRYSCTSQTMQLVETKEWHILPHWSRSEEHTSETPVTG